MPLAVAGQARKSSAQLRGAAHAPAAQMRAEQAIPQLPQLAASVWRFTSQPLAALRSQSARPALQVMPHRPAVHVRVPPGPPGQTLPQAPQLSGLSWVLTHAIPQRVWFDAQPDPHAAPRASATHTGVDPAQRFEQLPQVSTAPRSASQPLTGLPSQSS